MQRYELLARLARPGDSRIVLLVLDGVGDLRSQEQGQTALEQANLPNLDALARRGCLGHLVPVAPGVTPGSGPGHLALFGYDPTRPEADIGRGVLEALGLGLRLSPDDIAVRGNFATADADGNLLDRRAGRISTEECQRLCRKLQSSLEETRSPIEIYPGEGHRFVMVLRGAGLSAQIGDTDPQRIGVPPRELEAQAPEAESTVAALRPALLSMLAAIAAEEKANRILLRGFSRLPNLPSLEELYELRCGAFAGYPLYRGVAAACGMEVVPCGKGLEEIVASVRQHWQRFDFFFLHIKQSDQAGEDGDLQAKVRVLEQVDRGLPQLLRLSPDVLAVTGDHSTPVPVKGHSWHPVPLLLASRWAFVDECESFTELAATRGYLGTVQAEVLMGLLLAHAGRLAKYGA